MNAILSIFLAIFPSVTLLLAASLPPQIQDLKAPLSVSKSTATLLQASNYSNTATNSLPQNQTVPPQSYMFRLAGLPYVIFYNTEFDEPFTLWSIKDIRRLALKIRVDLASQKSAALPRTEIPDHSYSYVSHSVRGGMMWVIDQDQYEHPAKRLTYEMAEVALIGMNEFIGMYGPGETVKPLTFLVKYEPALGMPLVYLAEGALDDLSE